MLTLFVACYNNLKKNFKFKNKVFKLFLSLECKHSSIGISSKKEATNSMMLYVYTKLATKKSILSTSFLKSEGIQSDSR